VKDTKHMRGILTERSGRPLKLVRLQKRVELRRLYAAHQPRWRHSLVGYLVSIPIVALGVAVSMLGRQFLGANFFSLVYLSLFQSSLLPSSGVLARRF
jgi:hypothetical protein